MAGPYDLLAVVRVREHEHLADVVTQEIARISGVAKTQTAIAFRTYSKRDLEAMWSIGLEERAV